MKNFLGFDFFCEQTVDGLWTGYGTNGSVKLETVTEPSLNSLYSVFERQAVVYQCQADMGASWVTLKDDSEAVVYVNLPCQALSTEVSQLAVDINQEKTAIYDGIFDNKKAQYRVNVRPFKHYALCKLIGIYTEPNLLKL